MSINSNYCFVGPTAFGCENLNAALNQSFTVLPPAKRGDIALYAKSDHPGIIVIVDGLFHASPSVGHAELRDAIERGWTIWGLSSLGAIRAAEMKEFGMKGFGQVYERYLQEDDFQDDEVALLHGPLAPFPPISEPLIHLRLALAELQKQQLLTIPRAEQIAKYLKSLWYGSRSLSLFQKLVFDEVAERKAAEDLLASFERFRVKTTDLTQFLHVQPWKAECGYNITAVN